uniref:Uncharacterized protein n=1 Tax=Cannabis sativa TaxID=3483 RepID=A0A803NGV9_CANSA
MSLVTGGLECVDGEEEGELETGEKELDEENESDTKGDLGDCCETKGEETIGGVAVGKLEGGDAVGLRIGKHRQPNVFEAEHKVALAGWPNLLCHKLKLEVGTLEKELKH